MTHQNDYTLTRELAEKGLVGIPELLRVLINSVMQAERSKYLQAEEYKLTEERRGHANRSITLDVYGHLVPSMQNDLGEMIDDLVMPVTVQLN